MTSVSEISATAGIADIVTDHIEPLNPQDRLDARQAGHFAWIDLRGVTPAIRDALVQAAIHHRIDGIVTDDADLLATLPPTMRRILATDTDTDLTDVDILLTEANNSSAATPGHYGVQVIVSDAATLHQACTIVREADWTVLTFTDPTKIPLEIVIAAAENSTGRIITVVTDITDAAIVKLVLEHGSDGLLLAPTGPDDIAKLAELVTPNPDRTELVELIVTDI